MQLWLTPFVVTSSLRVFKSMSRSLIEVSIKPGKYQCQASLELIELENMSHKVYRLDAL